MQLTESYSAGGVLVTITVLTVLCLFWQRLTCCMSLLLSFLCVNIAWYRPKTEVSSCHYYIALLSIRSTDYQSRKSYYQQFETSDKFSCA